MSLVTHLLLKTADIYRRTRVSDGQGGYTYSYALIKASAKCKIDQASDSERVEAEQAGSSFTHKVYLNHDQDVQRGDEIRRDGKTYFVKAVIEPDRPGVYRRANSEFIQSEGDSV